ncbi:MAG: DUF4416 family protein [Planctomycetes bacterium]|nr:DUF4416 family protein [Planctomycetota bacterium]
MAEATEPSRAKLICGMLAADEVLFAQVQAELAGPFGPIDVESPIMEFDFTHYYDSQMGSPLKRRFVAFERLVAPDALILAKHATNDLERAFSPRRQRGGPARPVNIDPGIIEEPHLVLASMKNFSHRIYLGWGVYADLTLMYRAGKWEPLPWTFPDYASGRYFEFLSAARANLRRQTKEAKI